MMKKICGALVDILCEMNPNYKDYIVFKDDKKFLCPHHLSNLRMLVAAMLFYKKLVADLTKHRFEVNSYNPCAANKMVDGKESIVT